MATKRTTSPDKPKMYIIRKYIMATNASQAIQKDKTTPVHDAWVDNDWKGDHLASAIGFDDGRIAEEEE